MQPEIVFGNAHIDGADCRGWFMGNFITPFDNPRSTKDLEVKLAIHKAGEMRPEWSINQESTTLSILIHGRFRLEIPDKNFILSKEGDYVLWPPGIAHSWYAETDSTILTVRWPSTVGSCIPAQSPLELSNIL
jgi:quercetin dioxygenase-like cupin family protein